MMDLHRHRTWGPEQEIAAFEAMHLDAALAEGWIISDCGDSENGRWQICHIPRLKSDDQAWLIVRTGTGPHHAAARAFIERHNILEWNSMNEYVNQLEPK